MLSPGSARTHFPMISPNVASSRKNCKDAYWKEAWTYPFEGDFILMQDTLMTAFQPGGVTPFNRRFKSRLHLKRIQQRMAGLLLVL